MAFLSRLPDRRQFLGLAVSAASSAAFGQATRRPNVLYIIADEWRAQATGYNGDPNVQAPVLDRLRSQSVDFATAVSGCPVCCPHRASLMTGQYPLTNGVYINDVPLKPNGVTWEKLSPVPDTGPVSLASGISTGVRRVRTRGASI